MYQLTKRLQRLGDFPHSKGGLYVCMFSMFGQAEAPTKGALAGQSMSDSSATFPCLLFKKVYLVQHSIP